MINVTSNVAEIVQKLKAAERNASTYDFSAALVSGVNAGMALMKNRIFNTGQDAEGQSLGKYTGKKTRITSRKHTSTKDQIADVDVLKKLKKQRKTLHKNIKENLDITHATEEGYTEYEKTRVAAGRQIAYKDLEFHGSLRRAIVIVQTTQNQVDCLINNKFESDVARWQEKQIGEIRKSTTPARIFEFSQGERDTTSKQINEALNQIYDRIVGT